MSEKGNPHDPTREAFVSKKGNSTIATQRPNDQKIKAPTAPTELSSFCNNSIEQSSDPSTFHSIFFHICTRNKSSTNNLRSA